MLRFAAAGGLAAVEALASWRAGFAEISYPAAARRCVSDGHRRGLYDAGLQVDDRLAGQSRHGGIANVLNLAHSVAERCPQPRYDCNTSSMEGRAWSRGYGFHLQNDAYCELRENPRILPPTRTDPINLEKPENICPLGLS
jgi:hypothetical protein